MFYKTTYSLVMAVFSAGFVCVNGAAALATSPHPPAPVGLAAKPAPSLHFQSISGANAEPMRFVARGRDYQFFIGSAEATLALHRVEGGAPRTGPGREVEPIRRTERTRQIRLEFVGADAQALVSGTDEYPGKVHYLSGQDPAVWQRGVSAFARLQVKQLYPGVDLVYYGSQGQLEYDFVVAPGRDPDCIAIRFSGADAVEISPAGDLILRLGREEVRQPKPFLYQTVGGERRAVAGGYRMRGAATVGFVVSDYNRDLPLTIDPILNYSTCLGGGQEDTAWAVAVDASGCIYVAGSTLSAQLATPGAFKTNYASGAVVGDAYVAKFDPTGSTLLYLTYLGGRGDDAVLDLTVDASGCAYVTGMTDSPDFPIVSGIRSNISGTPVSGHYPIDGFVAKLVPSGSNLVYSTYLGGNSLDEGIGIAVDAESNAYVTGFTYSSNFPVANALSPRRLGDRDAFVTKIASNGTAFVFSTYLGGTNADAGQGIAIGTNGAIYVTGWTASTNFPTTNAIQPWLAGGYDMFVTVMHAGGSNLVQSTYLGGYSDEAGFRIAVDAAGNAYVTGEESSGSSSSGSFPMTAGNLNGGGIFKSDDAAASWTPSYAGLIQGGIQTLAVDPVSPSRLYAGTSRGLARSSDGGATWDTSIKVPAKTNGLAPAIAVGWVTAFAINPASPSTLYAGSDGVYKSVDAGTNWTLSSTGLVSSPSSPLVWALAIDPLVPTTLYAGTYDNGVFKSTNAAATWTAAKSGLGNLGVAALVVDPATPSTLYAGTSGGGVYRSTDAGAHWAAFNNGLSNLTVRAMAVDSQTPSTLYAGTVNGLFKTTNRGTNWSVINPLVGSTNVYINYINAIAVDPLTPTTLYAGTYDGLFKSLDAGNTWTRRTNGLRTNFITIGALAVTPQVPATLYCGFGIPGHGGSDVFLTKLTNNATEIECSVVFGGDANDEGWDLAVDPAGNVYVTGLTASTNFPKWNTPDFLSTTNSGRNDAFVIALNNQGVGLYSGYLGGTNDDFGYAITADAAGNAYLAGQTFSTNFPSRGAYQPEYKGTGDAFLARILADFLFRLSLADGQVELKWSAFAPEFILESNTNVTHSAGWTTVPQTNILVNGWHTVTLGATNNALFFRLRKP